jgi:histidine phosphotransfer protein HptB
MTDVAIDLTVFKELQDTAGEDFVKELVDTFLAEAPQMLNALRDALAAGDADKFRRAAHSFKSNSHTFGAMALGAMARELEHKGLDYARQPAAGSSNALDALAQEYGRVAARLTGLCNG